MIKKFKIVVTLYRGKNNREISVELDKEVVIFKQEVDRKVPFYTVK